LLDRILHLSTSKDINNNENEKLIQEYRQIIKKIDNFTIDDLNDIILRYNIKSPSGNELSKPYKFNLMFKAPIGVTGKYKHIKNNNNNNNINKGKTMAYL